LLSPIHFIWILSISGVCGAALAVGGPSEKYGACAFYGAWLATLLLRSGDRLGPQYGALAADIALMALLIPLALRSHRYWPIWMTGFHLLAVLTHAGRILDRSMNPWAYLTGAQIWGYLTLLSLAVGVYGAWQERRQLMSAGEVSEPPGATRR